MKQEQIDKLTKLFNSTVQSSNIKEAVLLVESSDCSFSKAISHNQNLESNFILASISKLYTTYVIHQLIEDNLINLNDDVSTFLSESELIKLNPFNTNITIKQCLSHTSQCPDYYESSFKNEFIKEDIWLSFEEKLELTANLKPLSNAYKSKKAYYSDINFDILGIIIERVLNTSLQEAYKHYIFNPLNLHHTFISDSSQEVPSIYYKDNKLSRPKTIESSQGSGAVISNALELMIFLKHFFKTMNSSNFEPFKTLQLQMTPIKYGMGLMKLELGKIGTLFMGKGDLLGHSGSTGSLAFYHTTSQHFIVGNFNQMTKPALPIRFVMKAGMILSK